MNKKRRVIFWSTAISDLLVGRGSVGGINVQLYLWAKTFNENGWDVYSFDLSDVFEKEGIHFIKDKDTQGLTMISYWPFAFRTLKKTAPDIVILRGGKNRNAYPIAVCCRMLGIKCVYMGGSDVDLDFDASSLSERINKYLFARGIKMIPYMVAQNSFQADRMQLFGKDKIVIIPNIWSDTICSEANKQFDPGYFIWVANTRPLKRPEWVIELARRNPLSRFVMIGGNSDNRVFAECQAADKELANLSFLGPKDFSEADSYFGRAKAFLCTSEFEGFPNTFLQAWCRSVPVLSTVNPNNLITDNNLGDVCLSPDDFDRQIKRYENDNEYVDCKIEAIKRYFSKGHSPSQAYDKLIKLTQ